MGRGPASFGPDGKRIELPHLIHTHRGTIAEVTQTFHDVRTKVIHVNWLRGNFLLVLTKEFMANGVKTTGDSVQGTLNRVPNNF